MVTDVARRTDHGEILERVVIGGDLSPLAPADRVRYYRAVCESIGVNPLTKPFEYLTLNSRLVLYAKKDCTDQLRSRHGVSITDVLPHQVGDLYVVTVKATDGNGRTDMATGAVNIKGLGGESLANAMMKAETKAKRRVTLSLCGLGMLDESEVPDTPGAQAVEVDPTTGEVKGEPPHENPEPDALISEAQLKRLHAIASASKWSDAKAKALLAEYGFASSKDVTRAKYEQIVEKLKVSPLSPQK